MALDNFYLVEEEQIRTARRHLPSSYSRELPRLASGAAATYPRVYGIVLDLISHVDGHVDSVSLDSFITAYQTITPLRLGELWAVPIMLRLTLIENLRRVAARVASSRRDRDVAGDWAERMVEVVERNPTDLILVMADMARANPALSGAFLAEMTRHLQGQSPHFAFANSWLAQRLSEQEGTNNRTARAGGPRAGPGRRSGVDERQQHRQPPVSQLKRLARFRRTTQPEVEQILPRPDRTSTPAWISPRAIATAM